MDTIGTKHCVLYGEGQVINHTPLTVIPEGENDLSRLLHY